MISSSLYMLLILATVVCFNVSSISVNEDEGLVTFAILLTNPSSTGITLTILTADITATGEFNMAHTYVCTLYNNYYVLHIKGIYIHKLCTQNLMYHVCTIIIATLK